MVSGVDLAATMLGGIYAGLSALMLLLHRVKGLAPLRSFAGVASITSAYTIVSAASLTGTFGFASSVLPCRLAAFLLGLHSAAWLLVCYPHASRTCNRTRRMLSIATAVVAATSLVPGWVCQSMSQPSRARGAALTQWGQFVLLAELLALAYALSNIRKSDWEGARSAAVAVGLLGLCASAAHEAAFIAGWTSVPFVLSVGYLGLLLAAAIVFGLAASGSYARVRELSERLAPDVALRHQELLQAQVALTRADRLAALGQLAAGVGHEINTPLTYVMTNLRELVEKLPLAEQSSDRIHLAGLASEALDGTERIRRVVSDLRLLTRSRENQELEPLEIHHVLGDALKLTEHVLRHRARVAEEYGDVPRVKAEPQRLAQVFVNLLVNAAQAIPETNADRGTITVRTKRSETGRAVVEIVDNGQGISAQHLGRLFEPYFTTKTQGEGTGLGLFVSLGIVRSFGGELEVVSEVGEGTTMRVSLPASDVVETMDPTPSQMLAVTPRRAKVLVVDDEPVVARALRRMLAAHDVAIALDARHALDFLEQSAVVDVVICDLMMPDLSGVDLYVQACERWPNLKPRFLFMTGGAVTPKAQELLQHGEVRCLHKPVRPEELLGTIDSIVAAVDLEQRRRSSRPMW